MNSGRIFLSGVLISFFGALPLGLFNMAALQVLMDQGVTNALYFIAGCIMAEMIYVRVSLRGMHKIARYEPVLRMLGWLSLVFTLFMAVSSFRSSIEFGDPQTRMLLSGSIPPFILGFLLMSVNATQIPFWFGWNAVLFIKKILVTDQGCYNLYSLGICLGSLCGYSLFMVFGQFVFRYMGSTPYAINAFIGSVFCLSALLGFLKLRARHAIREETI